MIVALFVVAFAMVIAGLAAIYDGYAIIVMEKGWTKVIAGAVAASAGFVLFGIVAALAQLKRIGADLARLREQTGRLDAAPPKPLAASEPAPSVGEALTGGPRGVAPPPPSEREASGGPLLGGPAEKPPPDAKDIATAPEPPPTDNRAQSPQAAAEPVPEQRPARGVEERQPAPKEAAPRQEPTVVGTYSSGGNTYVMYSDGSIRAETPTGLYRFDSLDELKAFIAAGGESVPPAR